MSSYYIKSTSLPVEENTDTYISKTYTIFSIAMIAMIIIGVFSYLFVSKAALIPIAVANAVGCGSFRTTVMLMKMEEIRNRRV
ncbi:MAG: hypothetical protein J0M03_12315 [Acidobacteria bacterium]|nr:hypothetical protein [Acidobacteriota bacterium]